MEVENRIKQLRRKMHLTQKQLADKINVSSQVISNWERGYSVIGSDDLARLAEVLDSSADYIIGKTDTLQVEQKSQQAELTAKDELDIAKRMGKIKKDLIEGNADGEALNFMGEPMSAEAMESLLEALEMAERITTLANKKYAPNKYKDKE